MLIPPRHAPRPIPRPDPAAGVFETLLVEHGRPIALDEHLARLAHSIIELYAQELPSELAPRLRAVAAAHAARARVRVRVNARPDTNGGTARIDLEVSGVPVRREPPELHPVVVPGGLGAHKWIDRRLLDALGTTPHPLHLRSRRRGPGNAPRQRLRVTPTGTLVTPPTDGRILPGVTREHVLQLAERSASTPRSARSMSPN